MTSRKARKRLVVMLVVALIGTTTAASVIFNPTVIAV